MAKRKRSKKSAIGTTRNNPNGRTKKKKRINNIQQKSNKSDFSELSFLRSDNPRLAQKLLRKIGIKAQLGLDPDNDEILFGVPENEAIRSMDFLIEDCNWGICMHQRPAVFLSK